MNKIVNTSDGSHTLYNETINEHYHSQFGAINESRHIFIDAGFKFVANSFNHFNILEVGFGTGLNAFLTFFEAQKLKRKINYIAVEPNIVDSEIINNLNYPSLIDEEDSKKIFDEIQNGKWGFPFYLSDDFIMNKINEKIQDISFKPSSIGLVYFDAFSPQVQPEMWSVEIFKNLYDAMITNSVLVTYSCKGDVKRALKEAGFDVEKIPGPEGKREIIRALKV